MENQITSFPKSNIKLPFDLGRTVRGCSFTENIDKDFFSIVISQVLQSENNHEAIDILVKYYNSEESNFNNSPMGSLEPSIFLAIPLG